MREIAPVLVPRLRLTTKAINRSQWNPPVLGRWTAVPLRARQHSVEEALQLARERVRLLFRQIMAAGRNCRTPNIGCYLLQLCDEIPHRPLIGSHREDRHFQLSFGAEFPVLLRRQRYRTVIGKPALEAAVEEYAEIFLEVGIGKHLRIGCLALQEQLR